MSNFIFLVGIHFSETEIIMMFSLIATLILYVALMIVRVFVKLSFRKLMLLMVVIPIIALALVCAVKFVYLFFNSPMTVKKYHLQGEYVINRDMFKGKNADWQYEHYRMSIDKDTMYLYVINQENKIIKTYKRKVIYLFPYHRGQSLRNHTFLEFDDEVTDGADYQDNEGKIHHMLNKNPRLMANPFHFNLILESEKYGNMFFTHGKWKAL